MEDLFVAMQWPTGNHSALLALVAHVSMYVCPRKPVSEACFDNILGTGFGMHLDGGDAYRAKRPPPVDTACCADEDISSSVLGGLLGN